MVDYKDLGNRVRIARKQRNMTQEELAKKAELSASFLGHIERGTRVASLDSLVDLCNALGVSPEYLLSGSLNRFETNIPDAVSSEDRKKLMEFLRLAQETLKNWSAE